MSKKGKLSHVKLSGASLPFNKQAPNHDTAEPEGSNTRVCNRVTTFLCHRVTPFFCHRATPFLCHRVTPFLCHRVTPILCHKVTPIYVIE